MANKNYCTFIIAYHDVTGLKCIQVIYAIVSRTIRLPTHPLNLYMHARFKTTYSTTTTKIQRLRSGRKQDDKKIRKNLKTSDRREGRQLGESEVMQYIGYKISKTRKI